MKFLIWGALIFSPTLVLANIGELEVSKGDVLLLKATGCEPGQKSVVIVSTPGSNPNFEEESADNPFQGNLMNATTLKNELSVHVECRRLYCVLKHANSPNYLNKKFKIALESVNESKAQFITNKLRTGTEADNAIKSLIEQGVCSHQRESYDGMGFSEGFLDYDTENPNNID